MTQLYDIVYLHYEAFIAAHAITNRGTYAVPVGRSAEIIQARAGLITPAGMAINAAHCYIYNTSGALFLASAASFGLAAHIVDTLVCPYTLDELDQVDIYTANTVAVACVFRLDVTIKVYK
jgi:hypothetical protein